MVNGEREPIVIVGGGLAGGNAAVTLREEGFRGRVVLISREPEIPFGRPPLSKTYLRSEEDLSGWYVRPAEWYQANDVERLGEAASSPWIPLFTASRSPQDSSSSIRSC